jgi:hypothetical protein
LFAHQKILDEKSRSELSKARHEGTGIDSVDPFNVNGNVATDSAFAASAQ